MRNGFEFDEAFQQSGEWPTLLLKKLTITCNSAPRCFVIQRLAQLTAIKFEEVDFAYIHYAIVYSDS